MKCLLLLLCAAALQAGVAGGGSCEGPVINGVHYTKEVLAEKGAKFLDYHKSSNTVYFTGTYVWKVNLDTKKLELMDENWYHSWTVDVDKQTDLVHVSSDHDIFYYNMTTKRTTLFSALNFYKTVWDLYPKGGIIYFIDHPSFFVYTTTRGGKESRYEELNNIQVRRLLIDNDDTIIFANTSGLFSKNVGADAVLFEETENLNVNDLNMKTNGEVYAACDDGIYALNKEKHKVQRVVSLRRPLTVAFDSKNNILYSDVNYVIRLLPSDDQDCI